MRRVYALSTAAIVALSAAAATSPAHAAFHLIKWQGTGICQIWDESIPTKPFPADYKAISKPVATFGDALAVKDGMLKKGACKF